MTEYLTGSLQYEELDAMEAPSWDSFYRGVILGLAVVGAVVAAT
ncbi:MAG: MpaA1 family daptide-type RiPP [Microbacterium sp.]